MKVELSLKPSLPPNDPAYIEFSRREGKIGALLAQSRALPELMAEAGFDPQTRRAKLWIFNHGSINVVGQIKVAPLYQELPVVKGTIGLDIPLAVAVISRSTGKDLVGATVADARGLNSMPPTAFPPTAKFYELLRSPDLAIMINEAIGAVRKESWGSAEVNSQIWSGEGGEQVLFTLNPYTAINPDRFSHFWRGGRDREAASFSLASGYVAALTQVWLLTGRVPTQFGINSGDGVYDASLVEPEADFSGTAPVRLTTLRCGLSQSRISLKEFKCWLASLETGTINYDKEDKNPRLVKDKTLPWVTGEIFAAGFDTALARMKL